MSIEKVKKVEKERLYHLDLIRFIAALYVVFYHYGYRGFARDNYSILQFPLIEGFSKYGYLGVDLFFIISGFVILMSAENSNIIDFCISRFTRLYPAYWVSIIFTSLVIVLFGFPTFDVTLSQVLVNLTMFNKLFGIDHVDGVYWSLFIELKFYFLIGILLLSKLIKYIKIFAWALLIISIIKLFLPFGEAPVFLKIIYYMTFPRQSPYFIAGMFFFLIKSEKNIIRNILPILLAYCISIKNAYDSTLASNELNSANLNENLIVILISLFFILMFLVSINKLTFLNKKSFLYLGVLTYPLYLIHQNIGYIIFNNLGELMNKWLLLFGVIVFMLIASYFLNKHIEKPFGAFLRLKLRQNKQLNKLK